MHITFITMAVAAAIFIVSSLFPASVRGESATVEHGKDVFERVGCFQCHGRVGQGGGAGPALAPNPLPFAIFSHMVRNPSGQMPPYTVNILSNEDLQSIHSYLSAIEAGPSVEDLPILHER